MFCLATHIMYVPSFVDIVAAVLEHWGFEIVHAAWTVGWMHRWTFNQCCKSSRGRWLIKLINPASTVILCLQVSVSGYIISGLQHPKSAKPWKDVPRDARTAGGLVSAAAGNGVWISLARHRSLRVCRSDITGRTEQSTSPVLIHINPLWAH